MAGGTDWLSRLLQQRPNAGLDAVRQSGTARPWNVSFRRRRLVAAPITSARAGLVLAAGGFLGGRPQRRLPDTVIPQETTAGWRGVVVATRWCLKTLFFAAQHRAGGGERTGKVVAKKRLLVAVRQGF